MRILFRCAVDSENTLAFPTCTSVGCGAVSMGGDDLGPLQQRERERCHLDKEWMALVLVMAELYQEGCQEWHQRSHFTCPWSCSIPEAVGYYHHYYKEVLWRCFWESWLWESVLYLVSTYSSLSITALTECFTYISLFNPQSYPLWSVLSWLPLA